MATDGLISIKEIKETNDVAEVNSLLAAGWKLVATHTYVPFMGVPENQELYYSLGRVE